MIILPWVVVTCTRVGEEHVHNVSGAGLYPDPPHPLPGHTLPVKQVNKRVAVSVDIVHSEGLLQANYTFDSSKFFKSGCTIRELFVSNCVWHNERELLSTTELGQITTRFMNPWVRHDSWLLTDLYEGESGDHGQARAAIRGGHPVTPTIGHHGVVSDEPALGHVAGDGGVVGPHPELLQQVHIVLWLVDVATNGRHPKLLVLGAQCVRHAPGVQRHHPQL